MHPRVSALIVLVLLALLGGSATFIMYRLENPPQLAVVVPSTDEADPLLEGPSTDATGQLILGSIEQFEDVVQRPLFTNTRRPPPPPSPTEPEQPEVVVEPEPVDERDYTLVGVMVTPDATTALLKDDQGSISRVRIGEKIDDWQLEQVNDDNVVLRQGSRVRDIPLLRNQGAPASTRQDAAAGSRELPLPATGQEDPQELRRRLLEQHRALRQKMQQNSSVPNRPRPGAAANKQ